MQFRSPFRHNAAAAPLVGMTGAVPVAIVLGNGAAAPGAYFAVGITLLLFSVGYAAMSQRVTNAGAFFAYVGRGLGKHAGIASAFVSILAYVAVQLAIYGFFEIISRYGLGTLLTRDVAADKHQSSRYLTNVLGLRLSLIHI